MKVKFFAAAILLLVSGVTNAINSNYANITEIKSWDTKNDIYLSIGHDCGGTDVSRYNLAKEDNQKYALLLSAFISGMYVNLAYNCGTDGYPIIVGVRARKAP